jgi:hypothetical protein
MTGLTSTGAFKTSDTYQVQVIIHLCIYVSIYLCIYVSMYLYIYVSMYLSIYICIYVSMYLSIYLCIYVSMYLCIYLCIYVSIYLSIYLSHYLSLFYVSILYYLSISLSLLLCSDDSNVFGDPSFGRLLGKILSPIGSQIKLWRHLVPQRCWEPSPTLGLVCDGFLFSLWIPCNDHCPSVRIYVSILSSMLLMFYAAAITMYLYLIIPHHLFIIIYI